MFLLLEKKDVVVVIYNIYILLYIRISKFSTIIKNICGIVINTTTIAAYVLCFVPNNGAGHILEL